MGTLNDIATLILNAGILQGIFLALILLSLKSGSRRSNRMLAVLLLVFSANIAHLVIFSEMFHLEFNKGLNINEPFQFLLGPLIYLYVLTLTKPDYRFGIRELRHFIPFMIFIAVIIPLNSFHGWGPLKQYFQPYAGMITTGFWAVILLHVTTYILLSDREVKRHERELKECYSDFGKISGRWMQFLIYSLLVIYIHYFVILAILIHIVQLENPFFYFQKAISVLLSIALYGIGYHGLKNAPVFTYKAVQSPPAVQQKYDRSGLGPDEMEEIAEKVLTYMEREKPYLIPELTLPELAGMLEVPRNKLSQVLNEKLGCNFYDFVSGYRIRQIQTWMADPEKQHLKILALALDAGFNSKAAFNQVFKKNTGITPSEYKKTMEIE